jgi:hypothetical protein
MVDAARSPCSDGLVGDEEELLEPGGSRLPGWIWLAALAVAVLAVAALITIRVWPRSTHRPAAGPPAKASRPSAVSPTTPETRKTTPPWPTAPGACNSSVDLPLVSSTPRHSHTGITVLLGGNQLRTVDFDSGRATAISQTRLRHGEYVVDFRTASQTYAVLMKCEAAAARILRIGADGTISDVALPGSVDAVLADDANAWGVVPPSPPTANNTPAYLIPLDGGRQVRLPTNFYPLASASGVIVGSTGGTGALLLVDAATGHVRGNLGEGQPVAVGDGIVLWTIGCDPSSNKPCTLHRRSVAGGTTSSYRLPRPPGFASGLLSPNGRQVAFVLERAEQDPRYDIGNPIPPTDIVILHLDTGRLEIVPGIEAPATMSPSLAFSADGRWLLIALDAGSKTRLLAWRSGLAYPYETTRIADQGLGAAPIAALPLHTDD